MGVAEKAVSVLAVGGAFEGLPYATVRSRRVDLHLRLARTGREALDQLVRLPAQLLLLEPRLSDMAGQEVLRAARSREPGASAIALVSASLPIQELAQLRTWAADLLFKPLRPGRLRSALERAARELASRADGESVGAYSFDHVIHELGSPLSVVQSYASSLLHGCPEGMEQQRRGLEAICRGAAQACRLLGELTEMVRLKRGLVALRLDRLRPSELIAQVCEEFAIQAGTKGVRLLDLRAEESELSGDALRLRQVLGNLIGNALRLTPPGGEIRVGASSLDDFVEFYVEDTGPGISPERQRRIFDGKPPDESYSTGLGLGLVICRRLVELHGGRIGVSSRPGGGSRFNFLIPKEPAGPAGHR